MKNIKIKNVLNKVKFNVVKHSPEILIGIGIAGVVTSTVLACRSTLKVQEILDYKEKNICIFMWINSRSSNKK